MAVRHERYWESTRTMASIEKWTTAAKSQHNNSVRFAVPASSRPLSRSGAGNIAWDMADFSVVGALFAGLFVGTTVLVGGVRRLRHRNKRIGARRVNDRAALLFYEDRVDVHRRSMLQIKVLEMVESHPVESIQRPEHEQLIVEGTSWYISGGRSRELSTALEQAGIEIS